VTVPLRLKFCSSRGPIVSAGDELAGGLSEGALVDGAASWASAGADIGPSASAAANVTMPKRKPALIWFRSLQ
jgi:hypothetical protein